MDLKLCLLMFLFLNPFVSLTEDDLKEEYEDCRNDFMKSYEEVVEEIFDRQFDRDNMYYDEYRHAGIYLKTKDN